MRLATSPFLQAPFSHDFSNFFLFSHFFHLVCFGRLSLEGNPLAVAVPNCPREELREGSTTVRLARLKGKTARQHRSVSKSQVGRNSPGDSPCLSISTSTASFSSSWTAASFLDNHQGQSLPYATIFCLLHHPCTANFWNKIERCPTSTQMTWTH